MFFRHSLIYLLARGVPSFVAFLSIVVFTRLLEPSEYGVYTLVFTAALLLSSVFFQWLRLGLLRYYQEKDEAQKSVLVSTIALVFLCVALSLGVLITPALFFFEQSALIALVLLIGIVSGAFDILQERARVELSPWRFGAVALARALLMLIGGVAGFEFGGVLGLLLGMLLGISLVVGVELISSARMIKLSQSSRQEAWQLLRFGGPLAITFVLAAIMGFSDRYMLAWLQNTAAAGSYSVAYDLTQKVILTLMMIVNLAGYPLLLKSQAEGDDLAFKRMLNQAYSGLLFVALPVLVLFLIVPELIVNVMLGPAFFAEALVLLPWLAVSAVLLGMKSYYFDLSFQLKHKTIYQVWIVAFAAGLNVALNYWLIPAYGGLGAAWATLAANILAILLSFLLSRSQLKLVLSTSDSIRIVISALAMGMLLWWVSPWLMDVTSTPLLRFMIVVACSGGVYLLSMVLFNVFNSRDVVGGFISSLLNSNKDRRQ